MTHPKLAVVERAPDMRLFFCYCCAKHRMATYCHCCGSRACSACLEWEYECRHYRDAWCIKMHVPLRQCTHESEE
jgi:hypothetical protein